MSCRALGMNAVLGSCSGPFVAFIPPPDSFLLLLGWGWGGVVFDSFLLLSKPLCPHKLCNTIFSGGVLKTSYITCLLCVVEPG